MNTTTVAVDLAKCVFFNWPSPSINGMSASGARLIRSQFEKWFINRDVSLAIMEACGSAHHWARQFNALGIEVKLLPAAYIRAYVRRNITDAADNSSGSSTPAACTDWRFGDADSMSARITHEPTSDAAYTTAGSSRWPRNSISLLNLVESPYRKG